MKLTNPKLSTLILWEEWQICLKNKYKKRHQKNPQKMHINYRNSYSINLALKRYMIVRNIGLMKTFRQHNGMKYIIFHKNPLT